MYIIVAMMLLADQPFTSHKIELTEAVQIAEKVQLLDKPRILHIPTTAE